MQVAFALFADCANLSQEGKLNILGVFDALQVGAFPAVHPRAHLILHLKGTAEDSGGHSLSLRWGSPSGEELWESTGELEVGTPHPGSGEMDLPIIAQIDLPMDGPGTYHLTAVLDGLAIARVPVHVRQAISPQAIAPRYQGMLS